MYDSEMGHYYILSGATRFVFLHCTIVTFTQVKDLNNSSITAHAVSLN